MSAAEKAETKPPGAHHNLWQIAKLGDLDQLERALARGADVNACNNLGLTPLMMAAYHGQTEMVKALVEHGADVNAFDNRGLRAAMLAKDSGHAEILRTLGAPELKKSPAAPQSEASPVRFVKSESVDARHDLAEVATAKEAEVKTLKEPPEIWDLVHEAPPDFRPSSTFAQHFVRLHPLVLAGILVVIGCSVGFLFAALGTRTNTGSLAPQTDHAAASLPLASDRTNATSSLDPKSPLSDRAPSANQDPTQTPTSTNPVRDTPEAFRNIEGGVAGEDATNRDNEQNANHESVESDASGDGGGSSSLRSSRRSVAFWKNKRRAALRRQSESENEANRTVPEQAKTAPSTESISPAKPDPTPKPKVIPWP
jgi:ankyrin repeat protein